MRKHREIESNGSRKSVAIIRLQFHSCDELWPDANLASCLVFDFTIMLTATFINTVNEMRRNSNCKVQAARCNAIAVSCKYDVSCLRSIVIEMLS